MAFDLYNRKNLAIYALREEHTRHKEQHLKRPSGDNELHMLTTRTKVLRAVEDPGKRKFQEVEANYRGSCRPTQSSAFHLKHRENLARAGMI